MIPRLSWFGLAAALALCASAAFAQLSGRAGRVSAIEGAMELRGPEDAEWSRAPLNYPVGAGMALRTESGTRAEIQFGGGSLRLDGRTAVSFLRLDHDAVVANVRDGSINLRVNMLFEGEEIALETPEGRVDVLQPGSIHVDAGSGVIPTRVAVLEGRIKLTTRGGAQNIAMGHAVDIQGDGSLAEVPIGATSLDEWAALREQSLQPRDSARYVGPEIPGTEDLDRAGTWQTTVEYGAVWYPNDVGYGWEPYRYGRWDWVAPWGWTWIDDRPWGFAPFHYGRWAYVSGRWGWAPGERIRRPIYGPAIIGFRGGFNDRDRFNSRRTPPVGWIPLAPGEIYRPPYSRDPGHLRDINRGHIDAGRLDRNDDRSNGRERDFTNQPHLRQGAGGNDFRTRDGRSNPIVITDPAPGATPNPRGPRRDVAPPANAGDNLGSGNLGAGNLGTAAPVVTPQNRDFGRRDRDGSMRIPGETRGPGFTRTTPPQNSVTAPVQNSVPIPIPTPVPVPVPTQITPQVPRQGGGEGFTPRRMPQEPAQNAPAVQAPNMAAPGFIPRPYGYPQQPPPNAGQGKVPAQQAPADQEPSNRGQRGPRTQPEN